MRIPEAGGDTTLATRASRLYSHTVSKAKLARQPTEPDATWVTLVWDARMPCRVALAADSILGHRGIDEVREAGGSAHQTRLRKCLWSWQKVFGIRSWQ